MPQLSRELREIFTEPFEFRELLYQITTRDLLVRYKQTAMGFAWALAAPLLQTLIFSVVFTRVAPIETAVPYPLFAYTGLLAWNFTASALRLAVGSLTSNTTLVSKVYFPREIFPFAAVAVALVDSLAAAGILALLMAYYHIPLTSTLAFVPIVIAVQAIFTTALALALSMANLFYRDVKYLFEMGLTVWLFASAVLYPSTSMHGTLGAIVRANPMTGIVEAYRNILLLGRGPDPSFALTIAVALAVLPAFWVLFHRLEFRFAERV